MLIMDVVTKTHYTYELTQEEERAVCRMIKENKDGEFDYGTDADKISKAFAMLHTGKATRLYADGKTTEIEFQVEQFSYSDYNQQDADEWLAVGEVNVERR